MGLGKITLNEISARIRPSAAKLDQILCKSSNTYNICSHSVCWFCPYVCVDLNFLKKLSTQSFLGMESIEQTVATRPKITWAKCVYWQQGGISVALPCTFMALILFKKTTFLTQTMLWFEWIPHPFRKFLEVNLHKIYTILIVWIRSARALPNGVELNEHFVHFFGKGLTVPDTVYLKEALYFWF